MVDFIRPYNNDPFVGHLATPITSSSATKVFLKNLPAYRDGLSPLLRGLEIGMAHGYLLLGPFGKLGPLRNSEIGLLAGFLSTIGLVTILVTCLYIYGRVTYSDLEQKSEEEIIPLKQKQAAELFTPNGWNQFTSGFLVGAYGGASFAYLTLTNFTFNI